MRWLIELTMQEIVVGIFLAIFGAILAQFIMYSFAKGVLTFGRLGRNVTRKHREKIKSEIRRCVISRHFLDAKMFTLQENFKTIVINLFILTLSNIIIFAVVTYLKETSAYFTLYIIPIIILVSIVRLSISFYKHEINTIVIASSFSIIEKREKLATQR